MTDMTKLLLQSTLGTELSEEQAANLSEMMQARRLIEGDYLIAEGTSDDTLHVLLEGRLEVVKHAGGDDEVSLAVLRDGDLAGELSFIDGEAHTVGLRALSASHVLSLQRTDFEGIVNDHPQLAYLVMRAVTRSVHKIVHRMNHQFIELNNYIFKQHGRY
ncbi:MAG: cyclic nucleotide-binding domain-containing protein [Woeseiaceae bacterium]|nr:cyclic nucleotide-binding domain-containing protein [Woeseiaceae bacterium]NIP21138.1 cyclic nucleotide-binding domain-containing protein [Woeseiaceae bacterium]NIS90110.1 cyclic nucleotide-binding domain-containing protein [Woeseiaceae bacterium]